MDRQDLKFCNEFNTAFSNAALHWMTNAELVVVGVAKILKPDRRFMGEFGGHRNVAAIFTAIWSGCEAVDLEVLSDTPYFFPTAKRIQ